MAHRQKPVHQSALPLARRLGDRSFTRAGISDALKLENVQNVTNWLARGVPAGRMPALAQLFGLTVDEYLQEAGMIRRGPRKSAGVTSHMESFSALPPMLQEYIRRKTADLRSMYDNIPSWLRDTLVAPKDPKQYAGWEREIEALVQKFREKQRSA
jgi:hypothetical protein